MSRAARMAPVMDAGLTSKRRARRVASSRESSLAGLPDPDRGAAALVEGRELHRHDEAAEDGRVHGGGGVRGPDAGHAAPLEEFVEPDLGAAQRGAPPAGGAVEEVLQLVEEEERAAAAQDARRRGEGAEPLPDVGGEAVVVLRPRQAQLGAHLLGEQASELGLPAAGGAVEEDVHASFAPIERGLEEELEALDGGAEVGEVGKRERGRRRERQPGVGEAARGEGRAGEEVGEPAVDGDLLLDGQRARSDEEEPRVDESGGALERLADPGGRLAGGRGQQVDGAARSHGPDEVHDRVEARHGQERDLELEHGALGAAEAERPAQGRDVPAQAAGGPARRHGATLEIPGGGPRGPRRSVVEARPCFFAHAASAERSQRFDAATGLPSSSLAVPSRVATSRFSAYALEQRAQVAAGVEGPGGPGPARTGPSAGGGALVRVGHGVRSLGEVSAVDGHEPRVIGSAKTSRSIQSADPIGCRNDCD